MGILSFSFRLAFMPQLSSLIAASSSANLESLEIHKHTKSLVASSNSQLLRESSKEIKPAYHAPITFEPVASGQSIVCGNTTKQSRLKIVRLLEPGDSASCAGRMLISGRMADVCAELDRMEKRSAGHRQKLLVN
ncbi:hypothetical protein HC248_01645 [Polaromonas vacuolata]|uniref:Uncharacterized protein n=1 Tax=Polaromonas vacuolata TaxID=37448 RepID=A0A6H2H942_9BURK|nr:hypothetical protein [Polaromonas vacuolata]QJC56340.1 hypothetical protein HC248_01645 [Polaromonas vacuolata]